MIVRFKQSLAGVYMQSYSSLYTNGMSHMFSESEVEGVIMVSAA